MPTVTYKNKKGNKVKVVKPYSKAGKAAATKLARAKGGTVRKKY